MSKIVNEARIKNKLIVRIRELLEHRAFWLYLLVDEAEKRGLPTVSGIDLLLYQAARAFKMFTGKDVDMPALLSALEGKLG
mgnify:CR=1 FL=1